MSDCAPAPVVPLEGFTAGLWMYFSHSHFRAFNGFEFTFPDQLGCSSFVKQRVPG